MTYDQWKTTDPRDYEPKQGHIREWADLIDAIKQVENENWQLKQALGYPIPADKDTPQNPFRCGICDARNNQGR